MTDSAANGLTMNLSHFLVCDHVRRTRLTSTRSRARADLRCVRSTCHVLTQADQQFVGDDPQRVVARHLQGGLVPGRRVVAGDLLVRQSLFHRPLPVIEPYRIEAIR